MTELRSRLLSQPVVRQNQDGALAPPAVYPVHVGSASTDWQALPTVLGSLRAARYAFDTVAGIL